jgi:hypothetical protein
LHTVAKLVQETDGLAPSGKLMIEAQDHAEEAIAFQAGGTNIATEAKDTRLTLV